MAIVTKSIVATATDDAKEAHVRFYLGNGGPTDVRCSVTINTSQGVVGADFAIDGSVLFTTSGVSVATAKKVVQDCFLYGRNTLLGFA